jgi:hypothetical protein
VAGTHGQKVLQKGLAVISLITAEHTDNAPHALRRAKKGGFLGGRLASGLVPIEIDPHRLAIFGYPGTIPLLELDGIVAALHGNSNSVLITGQQCSFDAVSICAVDGHFSAPKFDTGPFSRSFQDA